MRSPPAPAPPTGPRPAVLAAPRYGLRSLLGLMVVVAGLLVLGRAFGPVVAATAGLIFAATALHVGATRIGRRFSGPVRRDAVPFRATPIAVPGVAVPPAGPTAVPVQAADVGAAVVGLIVAGLTGGSVLFQLAGRTVDPVGLLAASVACGLVGSFAAFGLARFGRVVWAAVLARDVRP